MNIRFTSPAIFFTTLLTAALLLPAQASADDNDLAEQARVMDQQPGATVEGKLTTTFSEFAGSESNAQALVSGIRNGSEITISTNIDGNVSTATFTAPTGKTGYGNTFISLSLAKQELADLGIDQPSAEQIQAALVGGNISPDVQLAGILSQRAAGMGWGQIAKSMDMKLGPVISGMRSANKSMMKQAARPDKADKPAMSTSKSMDKPQRAEKPARPEKPERPQRPDKPERAHKL